MRGLGGWALRLRAPNKTRNIHRIWPNGFHGLNLSDSPKFLLLRVLEKFSTLLMVGNMITFLKSIN